MSWIDTINYKDAEGSLKKLYDRVKGPNDNIDNVLAIHSLRPHTLTAHMGLYKAVLHHSRNTLPKWYLETLGVFVSRLNKCDYCVDHHSAGLKRLLADDVKYDAIRKAIDNDTSITVLEEKWLSGIQYARILTATPTQLKENNISSLREAGFTDGEILEINQLTSYFNYVNRSVIGLGVSTEGDILGLSPNNNNDPNDWSHA
jgi:uncharacterized peroxidase-related enzyme